MRTKKDTTEKYRALVREYFSNGLNKTAAARTVGWAMPATVAGRLFRRPEVKKLMEQERRKLEKKYELTNEWIIERLMKIADAAVVLSKFIKVQEDGKLDYDFSGATPEELSYIAGLTTEVYKEGRGNKAAAVKKFKLNVLDIKGALDSLARIQGLFNDRLSVEGEVSLIDRINKGREQASQTKKETNESV